MMKLTIFACLVASAVRSTAARAAPAALQ